VKQNLPIAAMFTASQTPSQLKRTKTYGKKTRPSSGNIHSDFIEGQDFVFAQKNAPKRSHSGRSPAKAQASAPSGAEQAPNTIPPAPRTSTIGALRTPAASSAPQSGSRAGLGRGPKVTTPLVASIFDPPSDDDEPAHYQILPTRLKKAPTVKTTAPIRSNLNTSKIETSVANTKTATVKDARHTPQRPSPRKTQTESNIFDIMSSAEEGPGQSAGKRKRLPMKRATTSVHTSPRVVSAVETLPKVSVPEPPVHQAKKARISDPPGRAASTPLSSPPRPLKTLSGPSPRRTSQRGSSGRARLVQNEISAPAVLSSMVKGEAESPVCDSMDMAVEYTPLSRRRNSTTSARSISPAPPESETTPKAVRTTPRQEKLWDALLSPSPSRMLPLQPTSQSVFDLNASPKPIPTRRRLVDVLKAVAEPSSDIAPSDDIDEEETNEDDPSQIEQPSQSYSQAQSQGAVVNVPTRITYTSQRSFLAAPADAVEDFSQSLDDFGLLELPSLPGTTMGQANARSAETSDDDDDDESSKAMLSIHELRAAGGSRRFEDDVPLGDLEGTGKVATSRRRAALMELCKKLLHDPRFLQRFSQASTVVAVIERCKAEKDEITSAVLAAIVALTLHEPKSSTIAVHMQSAGVLDWIQRLLPLQRDLTKISKDRTSNMSKVAQTTVSELQQELGSSSLWGTTKLTAISPRLLALTADELLVRRLREAGEKSCLLTSQNLNTLLSILAESSSSNVGSIPPQLEMQEEAILSLLESFTIAETCRSDASLWNTNALRLLVESLEHVLSRASTSESSQKLVLRTCISLANNNESIAAAFAKPELLERIVHLVNDSFDQIAALSIDASLLLLDRLLLCCAALMNLAEWNDKVRTTLFEHDLDGLNSMVRTFAQSKDRAAETDSLEQSQINVAYGYLAIVLGNLCQNAVLRDHVRSQLPGKSLDSLVAVIEEFASHSQKMEELEDGSDDAWTAFTARVRAVADTLRRQD